ncbi:hypothetical protein QE152_g2059 [Popillia japonica]|uniref:Uncharacterized protein n=1 Tax=Popillia japonica TaxID=7064 RepID=A0AAW1N0W6_POPJA
MAWPRKKTTLVKVMLASMGGGKRRGRRRESWKAETVNNIRLPGIRGGIEKGANIADNFPPLTPSVVSTPIATTPAMATTALLENFDITHSIFKCF